MGDVTTIGLDIAKSVFRFMGLMQQVRTLFAGG
jgi:hypothetical protein